jgi:hypothetical protein
MLQLPRAQCARPAHTSSTNEGLALARCGAGRQQLEAGRAENFEALGGRGAWSFAKARAREEAGEQGGRCYAPHGRAALPRDRPAWPPARLHTFEIRAKEYLILL